MTRPALIELPATPTSSTAATAKAMRGNRRSDTKPELALRRLLHARGFRYRKDARIEAGDVKVKPDLVFRPRRVAVFVDGCFWHGCPEHCRMPGSNVDYWTAKIGRNRERDARVDDALRSTGWRVLRFWEHDDPARAADIVARALSEI